MMKIVFIRDVIKGKASKKSRSRNIFTMGVELYLRKVWEVLII